MAGFVHIWPKVVLKQPSDLFLECIFTYDGQILGQITKKKNTNSI